MNSRLYPKLLGASWHDLEVAVRRFHDSGATVRAVGVFQVRHGSNSLARTLARFAHLPAAGEDVEVKLQVTALEEGEEWSRMFAGHPLVSRQSNRSDGLLVESVGIVEIRFRLAVVGGTLSYQMVSAALRFGSLRLPLPHWLSPRITAWEKAAGDLNQIQVSVDVIFPLIGCLLAYEGRLT
jgi:hypothetical protein